MKDQFGISREEMFQVQMSMAEQVEMLELLEEDDPRRESPNKTLLIKPLSFKILLIKVFIGHILQAWNIKKQVPHLKK